MIDMLIANLLSPIFDIPTFCVILLLSCISIAIYYKKTGHNKNALLYAIASVIFLYGGMLFFIYGGAVLTLTPPDEVNNFALNSTQITQITLYLSNSSNPLESSQILAMNISNNSLSQIEQTSSDIKTSQLKALKKLGGGLFGNGLGLLGLGLALIGLGFYNKDRIDNKKSQEEILAHLQKSEYILKKYKLSLDYQDVYTIGLLWLCVGVIFTGLRMIFFSQFFIVIPIVGLIIIGYGYRKSKLPQTNPQEYTFDELIQKIRDESNLKKE